MANDLTMFDPKAGMPAHVAGFFGEDGGSNIDNKGSVPSLSPQGKMWTIALNGTKTKLEKRNSDGDVEPVNVMRVVVLDYAKRRGRAYYEGAYDPAKEAAPVCWSDDGITPDDIVPQKQAPKCDGCPMSVKGSKIAEGGRAMTACSQHRMLAVVPAHKLDFEPLRLKIAITSDWDKQSPEAEAAGWFGFQNYTDFLKSRGVQHTAAVVTKMKFDPNAAYPKIFFAADRWLDAAELAQVAPLTKDDKVKELLGGTYTPAGVDGVRKDALPAVAAEPEPEPEPAPTITPSDDDDDGGDIIMTGLDAPAAQPVQEAAQARVAAPAKATTKAAPKAAAAPATEPAPATTTDPTLGALLADWGGDD